MTNATPPPPPCRPPPAAVPMPGNADGHLGGVWGAEGVRMRHFLSHRGGGWQPAGLAVLAGQAAVLAGRRMAPPAGFETCAHGLRRAILFKAATWQNRQRPVWLGSVWGSTSPGPSEPAGCGECPGSGHMEPVRHPDTPVPIIRTGAVTVWSNAVPQAYHR